MPLRNNPKFPRVTGERSALRASVGRACAHLALRRSPRCAGRCRPEVYTFSGITFHGETPCERKAPDGVRWGAAGSREAVSRGGRRRRFRAGRTSHGLVVAFPRAKPIFPASGHETAPRPSAAAKAPGGPERSGGGAQRLAFVAVDGHHALLLPEAGKSRFPFPGPSGVRGTEGPGVSSPARRSAWWHGRNAPCSASPCRILGLGTKREATRRRPTARIQPASAG